mgnify:CR=1 FL=1
MSFKKQDIYKVLETITAPGEGKSLIENKNVTNVVTFGNEVLLDIVISNPKPIEPPDFLVDLTINKIKYSARRTFSSP